MQLRELALACIPDGVSRVWHNALMDYGSLVLHSKVTGIRSAPQSKFAGSDREVRGWVLKQLTAGNETNMEIVREKFPEKDVDVILVGLVKEGLILSLDGVLTLC